jgi:hypothetical protein
MLCHVRLQKGLLLHTMQGGACCLTNTHFGVPARTVYYLQPLNAVIARDFDVPTKSSIKRIPGGLDYSALKLIQCSKFGSISGHNQTPVSEPASFQTQPSLETMLVCIETKEAYSCIS